VVVEKNTGIVSAVIRELGIANCKKGEGEDPNADEEQDWWKLVKA
jgi:hypothetical protein